VASRPAAVAGLDAGELVALLAAGVVDFEDGLRIAKAMGEGMQEASADPPQAMLSVAGLRRSKLQGLCETVLEGSEQGAVCGLSTELFPKGSAVAGARPLVERVEVLAKESGALQARLLLCGAYHTPLMARAVPALRSVLEEVAPRMRSPTCDLYMNCSGRPIFAGTSPKAIIPLLLRQLTEPVLWELSMKSMIKAGACDFFEVGPRCQLKAIMKRIDLGVHERMTNIEA